jgi:hypothetical protein
MPAFLSPAKLWALWAYEIVPADEEPELDDSWPCETPGTVEACVTPEAASLQRWLDISG